MLLAFLLHLLFISNANGDSCEVKSPEGTGAVALLQTKQVKGKLPGGPVFGPIVDDVITGSGGKGAEWFYDSFPLYSDHHSFDRSGDTPWAGANLLSTQSRQPTADHCHPKCTWSCATKTCDAVCEPVCEKPQCQTRCSQNADIKGCKVKCSRNKKCFTRCSKPCETNKCPWCKVDCATPQCTMSCDHQDCQEVCNSPPCTFDCTDPVPKKQATGQNTKPEECPFPECHLDCERPHCEITGGYKDFPPLQNGWKVVDTYDGPAGTAKTDLAKPPTLLELSDNLRMAVNISRVMKVDANNNRAVLQHETTVLLPVIFDE